MQEYHHELKIWIRNAKDYGNLYLAVVRDLEDQSYFPVHFNSLLDYERYSENIISESKVKIIELIKVNEYPDI